jgi:hypothetical protein
MKLRYALAAASVLAAPLAPAQADSDHLHAPGCEHGLEAVWTDEEPVSVPAPDFGIRREGQLPATFVVNYNAGFPEGSPQRAAFQRAVDIWSQLLTSAVPIVVDASFSNLGAGVLGSAGSSGLAIYNVGGQPSIYGRALIDAIGGVDQNPGQSDITANFNSEFSDWYFGLDANPAFSEYDFVTVVLHELGHGLGFFGSAYYDNGSGPQECDGVAGHGCWGLGSGSPVIYDRFVEDNPGNALIDTGVYPQNSDVLGSLVISDDLFFDGPNVTALGQRARIDAADPFRIGSSYSHLDETVYTRGTINALMTRALTNGEAVHTPGPITCRLFQDLGWAVDVAACDARPVPVELAGFAATADGDRVRLAWDTQSETNNAGFDVEARFGADGAWEALGFVEGVGTTSEAQRYAFETDALAPGTYAFRLRQVDLDGTATIAAEVEATIGVGAATWLTAFPNPFAESATVRFAVQQAEAAEVVAYDVLGRAVATLYAGTPPAGETVTARFDGSALAPGLYVVRLQTESGRTQVSRLVKQ